MVNVADPIQVRGKVIPADELSWRFSRSSGPGGQSVNTSDSRVELSYDLAASSALGPVLKERALTALPDRLANGVLTVSASEHRSQLRNREAATGRLAGVLTGPPPRLPRPGGRPSRPAVRGNGGWPPSSAGPRSSASAAPPTSDGQPESRSQAGLAGSIQRRRSPVTVTASPHSASAARQDPQHEARHHAALHETRASSDLTTPALAVSRPASV